MTKEDRSSIDQLRAAIADLSTLLKRAVTTQVTAPPPADPAAVGAVCAPGGECLQAGGSFDEEQLFARFRARILKDAAVLKVLHTMPHIDVVVEHVKLEADGSTLRGRLALLIADDFFNAPAAGNAAYQELQRRGFSTAKPNVYRELDKLAADGFLTKEADGYKRVPGMRITKRAGGAQ